MVAEKPTLEALFEVEETPLLRFAHGIVRRRAVAEEMVQEAFMRLHSHWEEVEKPRYAANTVGVYSPFSGDP
ncbi:MAG: DNA-directed RNA polymerase specialized sigma24 family protein [Verrucomicrobiales bacterium]|jgi:RNA polymerase sigma-70 factor (ECF subfamily)